MSQAIDSQFEALNPAEVQRLGLERLRYERLMGVEFLPRVAFAPPAVAQHVAPVARAVVQSAQSTAAQPKPAGPLARELAAAQLAAMRPATAQQAELPQVQSVSASRSENLDERWKLLEAKALACQACVLASGRTNVVFGTGNRSAQLLFVGEGPGQDEDLKGEPFVGKAGQLLDKIIVAMGLKREDVYICNVVKCRPPNNRAPLPDEVMACSPYLFEQIELVAPKIIVALGGPATKTLLNTEAGITSMRGRWRTFRGIPLMPTFHPAYVLRAYTPEVRGQVWSDMQQVMAKLK